MLWFLYSSRDFSHWLWKKSLLQSKFLNSNGKVRRSSDPWRDWWRLGRQEPWSLLKPSDVVALVAGWPGLRCHRLQNLRGAARTQQSSWWVRNEPRPGGSHLSKGLVTSPLQASSEHPQKRPLHSGISVCQARRRLLKKPLLWIGPRSPDNCPKTKR